MPFLPRDSRFRWVAPAPVRRRLGAALAAGAIAVPLALTGSTPASAEVTFTLTRRLDGLDRPTQVTSAKDGSGRLFVTEQGGRVRVVKNGRLLRRPFLDLSSRVRAEGEGGLLSIAFHPDYVHKPYVWVSYTNRTGNLRVARFRAPSPTANRVQPGSFTQVIDVHHPSEFTNHYAGQLAFGLSRLLFVSTGDGGSGGDPDNHAQDLSTMQGKILRLKVLGARKACGRAYCVPKGNPYAGSVPGRGEIWASGLRNAWRMSVDPVTGDLWVGDVGQDRIEEVDRIPAGVGGTNLGWSCHEGTTTYDQSRCSDTATYLEPEWSYGRDFGSTVIGGFVYRGTRYADLIGGQYVFGDFGSGGVFLAGTVGIVRSGQLDGVTSFGEDDDRELWAVTYGGGLYELSAS